MIRSGGTSPPRIGSTPIPGSRKPEPASVVGAQVTFAFVRKPGYRGHEIDEPPVRGAEVAGRRVLLVDDAVAGGTSVERFTAVLNPPQAAIVAVGATEERVVPVNGETVVRPMVTLTGTFDHRAVDGAPAAAFLQTLQESLEDPGLAL